MFLDTFFGTTKIFFKILLGALRIFKLALIIMLFSLIFVGEIRRYYIAQIMNILIEEIGKKVYEKLNQLVNFVFKDEYLKSIIIRTIYIVFMLLGVEFVLSGII